MKEAIFYSLIADEVTDTGNKEELSLSLCFVLNDDVREVFVDCVEVERITGSVLTEACPSVAVKTRSFPSRCQRSML